MNRSLGICLLVFLAGCRESPAPAWRPEESPAGPNSEAPAFHVGPQGNLYLTWIEWVDDTTSSLRFSVREEDRWTRPREIARGTNWFVNWADRPGLTAFADGQHLAAYWLQKRAAGKYDYDVMIALSANGGESWGEAFVLHDDGISAEHGFVSATRDGDKLFYCWLDGRNTKKGHVPADAHGHDHHGAMSLRAAWLDVHGDKSGETELDSMVCDCCPTAVTATDDGLLVTYRDRSPVEVRDIAQVRWDGRVWSAPEIPHPDHWRIAGCPVNGPALAHRGDTICRAWYGVRDSVAHVSAALSYDGGMTWQEPIRIDENNPVGRVAAMAGNAGFLVTWIGQDAAGSTRLSGIALSSDGRPGPAQQLTAIDPGRSSGYPVIAQGGKGALAAFAHVTEGTTLVNLLHNIPE